MHTESAEKEFPYESDFIDKINIEKESFDSADFHSNREKRHRRVDEEQEKHKQLDCKFTHERYASRLLFD